MFRQSILAGGLLLAALTQHAGAVDTTRDPSLDANLVTAATQLDRLALLSSNDDWVFDFTAQQPFYNFAPGGVTNMNAATFPAAKGNGMTSECFTSSSSPGDSARLTKFVLNSGDVESRPMLHAATSLPPKSRQLRRRRAR